MHAKNCFANLVKLELNLQKNVDMCKNCSKIKKNEAKTHAHDEAAIGKPFKKCRRAIKL